MNNDKKKEYLEEYEQAVRQVERSEERLRELRLAQICPPIIADGMPHATGGDDLSGYAALWDKERRKYQKARYLRIKKCMEICDRIEQLCNEDEKDVLMYRYIRLMKWEEIENKMKFCRRQVNRIHNRALENLNMS